MSFDTAIEDDILGFVLESAAAASEGLSGNSLETLVHVLRSTRLGRTTYWYRRPVKLCN